MAALLLVGGLGGCATGDDPDLTGPAFEGLGSSGEAMTSTTTTSTNPPLTSDGPADGSGEGSDDGPPMLPDLGTCQADADCMLPPGFCLEQQGICQAGMCQHFPSMAGSSCNDGDPCTDVDACDGAGVCVGTPLECTADNTEPGTCVDGACTGMECLDGFEDCNGDMSDGCEVTLGSNSNCSACGDTCAGADHADGACVSGSCQIQCQAPWEDCDGNAANGCEVPVGVPHQCDATGLNPTTGCWTAYCGNSASADATNFGSFHCIDCATCRSPGGGQCQWCDHDSGVFFPVAECACGSFEDDVCVR